MFHTQPGYLPKREYRIIISILISRWNMTPTVVRVTWAGRLHARRAISDAVTTVGMTAFIKCGPKAIRYAFRKYLQCLLIFLLEIYKVSSSDWQWISFGEAACSDDFEFLHLKIVQWIGVLGWFSKITDEIYFLIKLHWAFAT